MDQIDLSVVAAGIGGFVLNGQSTNDLSGISVASAGDVNGDGLDDLIVGAYLSDPATGIDAGRSYVVFGKTTPGQSICPRWRPVREAS
ncbi:integrin alpha [Methylobacter sp.]|uniref:integrin alpha n=1 Tax=Methylobacter sp. TaxID=2051955 RepID=UPI002FDD4843